MNASDDEIDEALAGPLVEYDEALRSGSSDVPSNVPLDTSSAGDSSESLAGEFTRAKACLGLLNRVRRLSLPGQDDQETLGWRTDARGLSPDTPTATTQTLGRFRIAHELGRGGLGIVYLAYDPKLGRQVALKIPRIESLASDDSQRRFLREAEAAARLSHPNLISVFDAGEEGPICYIASEYCPGPTLSQWLRQRDEPVPPRWAADCVQQLAAGVQHAHGRGVLHRDIKPSNVLLAPLPGQSSRGSTEPGDMYCPKLADFGMAKLLEHANDQTRSGTLIGTPAYMAPEQATGQIREIDARADVYALGVVLYELMTGRPPFEGSSDVEILARVTTDEPRSPSRVRPEIPRDLAAICIKCLEKEPARRYATAQQLADDLGRFLRGEPTEARPPRFAERVWKWARRRPVVAGLSAALAVLLVLLVVSSVAFSFKLQTANAHLRQGIYSTEVRLAQDAMVNNDTGRALELLRRHAPDTDDSSRGDFAWQYLTNALHRELGRLPRHPGDVYSLSFAPDGRRLATACRDGRVRIWDWRRRQLLAELTDHRSEVNVVEFSPDGKHLVSGDDNGHLVLRDGASYAVRHLVEPAMPAAKKEIIAILFSPDATRIYLGIGNKIQAWDVAKGKLLAETVVDDDRIRALALSPDGQLLASVNLRLKLWRGNDLEFVRQLERQDFRSVTFLSNQRLIATRVSRDTLMLDVASDSTHSKLSNGHTAQVCALALSPGGQFLVSGGSDKRVCVCIPETDEHLATLLGHSDRVWDVRVAPSGDALASAGADGDVLFWNMPRDPRFRDDAGSLTVYESRTSLTANAFSRSGKLLAFAGNSFLAVVDAKSHAMQSLPVGAEKLVAVHFSSEHELIATEQGGNITSWDLTKSRPVRHTKMLVDEIRSLVISPDGTRLAAVVRRGSTPSLRLLSWPDGRELLQLRFREAVNFARFSPDGRKILVGGVGFLRMLDAQSFAIHFEIVETPGAFYEADFLSDGDRLLVAEGHRGLTVRNSRNGQRLAQLSGHVNSVVSIAASPNGRNAASVDERGGSCIWDLVTGQVLLQFRDTLALPGALRFSPTGDQLAEIRRRDKSQAVIFDATPRVAQPPEQALSVAP